MSVKPLIDEWLGYDFYGALERVTASDVEAVLSKDRLAPADFLTLLSKAASGYLERMALKARDMTVRRFGRVVQLYIPLYISNSCRNSCAYCGFSARNRIERRTLTLDEIESNAREIASTGMKHLLVLTGEDYRAAPVEYLEQAVRLLTNYFPSVSLEVYPLETGDYRALKDCGLDGLTIYQETYDPEVYDRVHLAGRKKDYLWRLDTPERAAAAGLRWVGIGTLFGLAEPVRDGFLAGIHAWYLQRKYPETEFSLSLPRMNEAEGNFKCEQALDDVSFVQMLAAYRLFLPQAGITISTRERAPFRDRLIPLGVTRMSAGSMTAVGAYTGGDASTPQFEISDNRSVAEIAAAIEKAGYEPVFKDWQTV